MISWVSFRVTAIELVPLFLHIIVPELTQVLHTFLGHSSHRVPTLTEAKIVPS